MERENATDRGMTAIDRSISPAIPIADFLSWIDVTASERQLGAKPATVSAAVQAFAVSVLAAGAPPSLSEFIANLKTYARQAATKDGKVLSKNTATNYMGKIRRAYRMFLAARGRKAPSVRIRKTAVVHTSSPTARERTTILPPPPPAGDAGPFGRLSVELIEDGHRILSVLESCPTYGPKLRPAFDRLLRG